MMANSHESLDIESSGLPRAYAPNRSVGCFETNESSTGSESRCSLVALSNVALSTFRRRDTEHDLEDVVVLGDCGVSPVKSRGRTNDFANDAIDYHHIPSQT